MNATLTATANALRAYQLLLNHLIQDGRRRGKDCAWHGFDAWQAQYEVAAKALQSGEAGAIADALHVYQRLAADIRAVPLRRRRHHWSAAGDWALLHDAASKALATLQPTAATKKRPTIQARRPAPPQDLESMHRAALPHQLGRTGQQPRLTCAA